MLNRRGNNSGLTHPPALSKEKKGKKMMKKMILMVVAMLSITTTYAENENVSNVANVAAYDMSVNIRKLGETLGLTSDQMEAVDNIHHTFSAEMLFAAQMNEEDRKAMVKKAIDKDVKNMRYILNEKQYHKYLLLLNVTLNNRGINE